MNIQSYCSLDKDKISKLPERKIEIFLSIKEPYTAEQYNMNAIDFDCYSIHSPFYHDTGFSLIDLAHEEGHMALEVLMEFAEHVAEYRGHKVSLIIHCTCSLRAFEDYYCEKVIDAGIELLPKYPNVDISIENGLIDTHNSCWLDEPVFMVEELNRAIPGNRFHTTLDIWKVLLVEKGFEPIWPEYNLEWFMERFAETCDVIHLAKCTHMSADPVQNRGPLKKEDPDFNRFISSYMRNKMTAAVTIGLDGDATEEYEALKAYATI